MKGLHIKQMLKEVQPELPSVARDFIMADRIYPFMSTNACMTIKLFLGPRLESIRFDGTTQLLQNAFLPVICGFRYSDFCDEGERLPFHTKDKRGVAFIRSLGDT